MPNVIDYLLENPERRWRIINYVIAVFVVTEALLAGGVLLFVKN